MSAAGATEIVEHVGEVADDTRRSAGQVEEGKRSSQQLRELAAELRQQVAEFRL